MMDQEITTDREITADQQVTPPAPEKPPRMSKWLALLIATVLIAASSGLTYLLVAEAPQAGVTTEVETPASVLGEEPIADAAAIIVPSVVQIQSQGGVGSGVIYDSDGLILTAAHVVAGQETVIVRFDDGEEVEGTVLGGTADADVAVVEVDRTGLQAAELALDEAPRVGQLAIAVGSPWGLQGTVTAGIISAVDQPVGDNRGGFRAMLQTDAAINPGNSGGALVDREGRVLGINVSIFSLSGANDGIGFAVPIDVANDIADRVLSGESLGVALLGVTAGNAESGQAGASITEVTPGSAADEAGIEVGDLIIEIDGVRVQGLTDLQAQVRSHRPGTTVELVVIRDGQEMTMSATLGEFQEESS